MRHGGAGLGEMGEVVADRPVQPGMMVEKNRMADDRFGASRAAAALSRNSASVQVST
jgi:hypothetical protein